MRGWGGGKAKEAVASRSDGSLASAAAAGRPDGAVLAAAAAATAAEEGRRPQHMHREHIDDVPMTPVVYIVSLMQQQGQDAMQGVAKVCSRPT